MLRKSLFAVCAVCVCVTMVWAQAVDEHTIAYWSLDEGEGDTVVDMSGNGNDGAITDAVWVEGVSRTALQFNGQSSLVQVPDGASLHPNSGSLTVEAWIKVQSDPAGWQDTGAIVYKGNAYQWTVKVDGSLWLGIWGGRIESTGNYSFIDHINEWHHAAVTFDASTNRAVIYVDGELNTEGTINAAIDPAATPLYLSRKIDDNGWFHGVIDEVRISDVARSQAEIQAFMVRGAELAVVPVPDDEETDVLRDAVLSWTPGEAAVTHDVYLGTAFDDVNDASRTNPMGVWVSQDQDQTTFDAGRLEFGQTYYWRVDEVNGAPDYTIFKGDIWSFTVESFVYPVENIVATTNTTSMADQGPERLVDGSGLDGNDLHSMNLDAMWTAQGVEGETPYVQFDFDGLYKLQEMLIWNYNMPFELVLGYGVKDATIEYSQNGVDWISLGQVELAQGAASSDYAVNNAIAMDGIAAQSVRMTIQSNFAGSTASFGLSEVRFTYLPVHAVQPSPADGQTDVDVDWTLSWKYGREAASHEVYLGTDPNALTAVATTSQSSYDPAGLDLETMYYWQVVEINEAETPSAWAGDIWGFSTQAYTVVEDFEVYTDDADAGEAIWQAWVDGYDEPENNGGSMVGYSPSPFAELQIVHGGSQSMPLNFVNTTYDYSEGTRTFDTPQDWTANGVESLTLHVYGAPGNVGGQLYVKINETKVYYDLVSDVLQRAQWVFWPIDLAATGADLSNVTSVSVGVEGSGVSGLVLLDDIRLYGRTAEVVEPILPSGSDPNLAAYYQFEGNANDTKGAYDLTTINGSPEYEAGLVGQAISVNGINDSVICSFDQEVLWPACSVSMWVKAATVGQVIYGCPFNNNSSTNDFQIDVDGTDPGNYRYHGGIDMDFGVVTTEWVHLATSCDGVQTTLYYNGLPAATGTVANLNFGQIAFGLNRAGDAWFEGLIDEARLYDRALSGGEVAALAGITDTIATPF